MAEIIKRTLTNKFRAQRAISLVSSNNFIFGFGRAIEWSSTTELGISDSNPPTPSREAITIDSPILYKKAFNMAPIVRSNCAALDLEDCSTLQTTDDEWVLLDWKSPGDLELIYKLEPSHVYIECNLSKGDIVSLSLSPFTYRSVGLFANPTFKTGVNTSKLLYSASEISSPGALCWHANMTPQTIQRIDCSKISIILNI